MARKTKRLFTIGYEQTPAKAVLDELEHPRHVGRRFGVAY